MIRYISAVWLPLSLTLISGSIGLICLFNMSWISSLIFGLIAFAFTLDVIGRSKEYIYLLRVYNKRKRLYWELFSSTRCAREVMTAIDPQAKQYYWLNGYRWYHVFPDNTFRSDSRLLKLSFWKTVCKPRKF